jgi:hypothetical protein
MKNGTTQCSARAFVFIALLLASTAAAQVLTITGGGRRVIDRDPDDAATNCLGWTYGPAPAIDDRGELVGMYTASDVLTQHCRPGTGIESAIRFGDAIQFHPLRDGGAWSEGVNVVDRMRLPWMNDVTFLSVHPQTFTGHVASPSVVRRDGRWFMAFAASLDDRNLCAGEHYAGNSCGSCFDPWSYFVIVWAVSDDGVNWRIRQNRAGDPTFLGRPPTAAERFPGSNYKGLTRVSLLAHGDDFYLATQYWAVNSIQIAMFRVPYDAADEWGLGGEAERVPTSLAGFLGSVSRTRVFGAERFIALNPYDSGRRISYQTSENLINWTPPVVMRSAIPFFADGAGYAVSVIDPIAADGADGTLRVYFASADGDSDHGIGRDGRHDCGLYDEFGPTAAYLGTGIYEATVELLSVNSPRRRAVR